jgi:hypothetical protein
MKEIDSFYWDNETDYFIIQKKETFQQFHIFDMVEEQPNSKL